MVKKINIRNIFDGLQAQMEAKLTFNRKMVKHPTTKGNVTELAWIEMLSTYLPKRYCVDTAFVIDSQGNISEQIDIVIFDRQYSPFILKQNGVTYVPVECVYAVLEVKQEMNKKNIEYARKKASSVRKLKMTSLPIPNASGVPHPAKPPHRIIAGIVTVDGKLSLKCKEDLQNSGESKILNIGCSLIGKNYFHTLNIDPWKKLLKPYKIENKKNNNESLVYFFMNLLSELQQIATVPMININEYLK